MSSNLIGPTIFESKFTTYILFSPSLNRYYIGQTSDLPARLRFHAAGSTDFTAQADDWQLVFAEPFMDRASAVALELAIKRAKSRRSIARYRADPRNTIRTPLPIADW